MRYVNILAERLSEKEKAEEIISFQSKCINELRSICYNLSSIDMDEGKFIPTLIDSISLFESRSKISTALVIDQNSNFENFPKTVYHNLFRIILEILCNIEKHANAKEITVLLRTENEGKNISVFISDDGKGLSRQLLSEMNSRKTNSLKNFHFGIRNIKLRLKEIGGTIKYISEENEGTTVEIRI